MLENGFESLVGDFELIFETSKLMLLILRSLFYWKDSATIHPPHVYKFKIVVVADGLGAWSDACLLCL